MNRRKDLVWWFDRTGSEILGWALLAAGLLMLLLPGPGLLALAAGVWLLARHNPWARKVLDPVHRAAVRAAKEGVATRLRIVMSALSAGAVMTVGIVWCLNPHIGTYTVFGLAVGPRLPFGGWGAGISIVVSSIVALVLLAYSVRTYRGQADGTE
jgi:hypothetical protein